MCCVILQVHVRCNMKFVVFAAFIGSLFIVICAESSCLWEMVCKRPSEYYGPSKQVLVFVITATWFTTTLLRWAHSRWLRCSASPINEVCDLASCVHCLCDVLNVSDDSALLCTFLCIMLDSERVLFIVKCSGSPRILWH